MLPQHFADRARRFGRAVYQGDTATKRATEHVLEQWIVRASEDQCVYPLIHQGSEILPRHLRGDRMIDPALLHKWHQQWTRLRDHACIGKYCTNGAIVCT